MMKEKAIVLLAILFLLIPAVASALTVSFVDNSVLGSQTVIVRFANGSYLGSYNTSTTVLTLDPNASYIFQMESRPQDYVKNPVALVDQLAIYCQTNLPALIIVALLGAIVVLAMRRR